MAGGNAVNACIQRLVTFAFFLDPYILTRIKRPMALKGSSTKGSVILGKPKAQDVNWRGKTIKRGVNLYMVGTDTAKHQLYNQLNDDADKPNSERRIHFPNEIDIDYFDGLVSEAFDARKNIWVKKKGKRNEPLDTRVYSIAASHHPELYLHKWKASDWDRRMEMLEPHGEVAESVVDDAPVNQPVVSGGGKINLPNSGGRFAR